MTHQEQLKIEKLEVEIQKLKRDKRFNDDTIYHWREERIIKWVAIAAMVITAIIKM